MNELTDKESTVRYDEKGTQGDVAKNATMESVIMQPMLPNMSIGLRPKWSTVNVTATADTR